MQMQIRIVCTVKYVLHVWTQFSWAHAHTQNSIRSNVLFVHRWHPLWKINVQWLTVNVSVVESLCNDCQSIASNNLQTLFSDKKSSDCSKRRKRGFPRGAAPKNEWTKKHNCEACWCNIVVATYILYVVYAYSAYTSNICFSSKCINILWRRFLQYAQCAVVVVFFLPLNWLFLQNPSSKFSQNYWNGFLFQYICFYF